MRYSGDQKGGPLSFLNIIPQSSSELVFLRNLNLASEERSPVSDVDLRFRTGWNLKLASVVWRILEFGIGLPFSRTSRWFETLISRLHLRLILAHLHQSYICTIGRQHILYCASSARSGLGGSLMLGSICPSVAVSPSTIRSENRKDESLKV